MVKECEHKIVQWHWSDGSKEHCLQCQSVYIDQYPSTDRVKYGAPSSERKLHYYFDTNRRYFGEHIEIKS